MKKPPPAKIVMETDSESNHSDEKMDSDDYKQVSFSSEVEVLEIEPRRQVKNVKNHIRGLRTDGIQNRLGEVKIKRTIDSNSHLHSIKKTINMKPNRTSPIARNSKMMADQSPINVKSRLDVKKRPKQLSNIHSRLNKKNEGRVSKGGVFNRLGDK